MRNVLRKALSVNERSRCSLPGPRPVHMRRSYTRRSGITPAILPGFVLLPPASPASCAAIGRTESLSGLVGRARESARPWREDDSDWPAMLGGELALVSSRDKGRDLYPRSSGGHCGAGVRRLSRTTGHSGARRDGGDRDIGAHRDGFHQQLPQQLPFGEAIQS